MSALRFVVISAVAVTLGGCGLFTPEMEAFWETKDQEKAFENIIVNNVKCEIRNGVYEAIRLLQTHTRYPGNDIRWLEKQGATVTLKLVVDEKSSLNPGISYGDTPPLPFSLGVGTANSADATRTEIVAFTYSFHDLLHERGVERYIGKPCDHEDGVLIQSDLKIRDFIVNKVFLAKVPGSVVIEDVPGSARPVSNPFSTFSYEVTFVVAYGINGTPTWKFKRIAVNPSSPLFSTSQQRTQDLTITIGKTTPATASSPATPSPEAIALHNAALIGQAVATAIQSQQR
ncbi:MAG TPA: hypothetical protein VNZ48_05030 [Xanthobacteraceae bacterium]|nr:hypothetical protein [Xanthobacteraceae bacterium]